MTFSHTLPLLGGKRGLTGRTGRVPENDIPRINYHSMLELPVLMKLLLCQTDSTNSIDRQTQRKTDEHRESKETDNRDRKIDR